LSRLWAKEHGDCQKNEGNQSRYRQDVKDRAQPRKGIGEKRSSLERNRRVNHLPNLIADFLHFCATTGEQKAQEQ
jgi:hypothetical protein